MNGSPLMLIQILWSNLPIPVNKWVLVLLYMAKTISMYPFSLWERVFLKQKIKKSTIEESPVFVIGHYRSGTTYLHKVLTCDKQWGNICIYNFIFPYHQKWLENLLKPFFQKIIRVFSFKNIHFNNYNLNLNDPLEEDMITLGAMTPHSAFWGEVFPKNAEKLLDKSIFFKREDDKKAWQSTYLQILKKISLQNGGKPLMLKNPPNTGRIKALLELFPNAKFIYIYRNPYQVYFSTWRLWKDTLEKRYALHKISDQEREEIIFSLYQRIIDQYLEEKSLIPKGNLVEIKYENFEKDPFNTIEKTYQELSLPDFKKAAPNIKKLLEKEKKYNKFSYRYDPYTQNKIYKRWGKYIDMYGYSILE